MNAILAAVSAAMNVSQSLPNQVNDFNYYPMLGGTHTYYLSQSLPNQVNDFNRKIIPPGYKVIRMSQSLPNQVNDFNTVSTNVPRFWGIFVAIPSKPGQRLQ